MSVDWQVERSARVCAHTGRELVEGEQFFSALASDGEGFTRRDYSVDAWKEIDHEPFFSFWRTRVRRADEPARPRLKIDVEAFYAFFRGLVEEEHAHRRVFLYLVTLILVRKRVLRLDEIEKTAAGEYLRVFDRRVNATLRVACPEVTPAELERAREQLNQIFECQVGTDLGASEAEEVDGD